MTLSIILTALVSLQGADNDRFRALSQIESGDNDLARGSAGEVSRYQILRAVWYRNGGQEGGWTNRLVARGVAAKIMRMRVRQFTTHHGGEPTDFQWALLWHCPARVVSPTENDRDYATRFCNVLAAISKNR